MQTREEVEADINARWSWAMQQVREHPKTAIAVTFIVGFFIGSILG